MSPVRLLVDYGDGDIDVCINRSQEHKIANNLWYLFPSVIKRWWRKRIGKSYEPEIKRLRANHGGGKVRVYNAQEEKVLV